MVESELRKISCPGRRVLLLCAGFMTMAFGIAFSIRATLLVGQVVKPLTRLMKKVEPMIFAN